MGVKKDTKTKSATEVTMNLFTGYFVGLGLNFFILPLIPGVELPVDNVERLISSLYVSVVYTSISWIRTYIFRRWFNILKYNWSLWTLVKRFKK